MTEILTLIMIGVLIIVSPFVLYILAKIITYGVLQTYSDFQKESNDGAEKEANGS